MTPLPRVPLALKRMADFALSLVGLVLMAPMLAALAILVRLTMGSPVLFRQERHGFREKRFTMVKFRTMRNAVGPDGNPLPDHQRLTRTGEFLRMTSLDELPELLNVLKGDMSLVGPRPLFVRYTRYFTFRERLRLEVRPGITGWAQVHGRNLSPWNERLEKDVWYVEHWSLWLDVRILAMTFRRVIGRSGVVADSRSVMQDLDMERAGRAPE